MSILCIQLQPNRVPALDIAYLRELCQRLSDRYPFVERFQFNEGLDASAYINLIFETKHLLELWQVVEHQLYRDVVIGAEVRFASIAVCQGKKGWDDYLLFHHFDRQERLDVLSPRDDG
jgi:hypothetical protein